jgi:lipopolysaccharide transport system permease protein
MTRRNLSEDAAVLPVTVIGPPQRPVALNLREVWAYRDLFFLLIQAEIKVRYRQTVIGVAWAILQPLLAMVAFAVIFGNLLHVPTDGIPYPVFSYCALVPWTYFTHALNKSTYSLVGYARLLTKVYVPRLVIPLAAVLAGFMDFMAAFVILLGIMVYYGIPPTLSILALPFFMLLTIATALGVGLWLAAINVQYRDIMNALPFLTQLWFFLTPVAYASSIIPEGWRLLYRLNPMTGVVEGFRWALLGDIQRAPDPVLLSVSVLAVGAVLIGGLYFFRRREDTFADVV